MPEICSNPAPGTALLGCCAQGSSLATKTFFATHPWHGIIRQTGQTQIDYCRRFLRAVQSCTCNVTNPQVVTGAYNRLSGAFSFSDEFVPHPFGTEPACNHFRLLWRDNPPQAFVFTLEENTPTVFAFSWSAAGGQVTGSVRVDYSMQYSKEAWWSDLLALWNALPAFDDFPYFDVNPGGAVNGTYWIQSRHARYDANADLVVQHDPGNAPVFHCLRDAVSPFNDRADSSRLLSGFLFGNVPVLARSKVRWSAPYCRFRTSTAAAQSCQHILGWSDEGFVRWDELQSIGIPFAQSTQPPVESPEICEPVECTPLPAAGEITFEPIFDGNQNPPVQLFVETMSPQITHPDLFGGLPNPRPCLDCNPAP